MKWLFLMLVVLGLIVIFGLINVINMAHGELMLIGAYTVVLLTNIGFSFWVGLLCVPIMVGLVGLLIETLIIRHIYHRFLDTILAI